MRKRPLALSLFSLALLGVAISLPVQAIYIQDLADLPQSLTLLNIFIMLLCTLTAVAAIKVHASFRILLPFTVVAVVFNNWWVGYVGFNYDLLQTSYASIGFVLLCTILLETNTFKVLLNPKLKWWEVATRAKTEIPVSLFPLRGMALNKKSYDISETGMFLQGLDKTELGQLHVGEKLEVCLHFNKILKFRCTTKIVRKADAQGQYPTGIGLQFQQRDTQMISAIKDL
jgi:hypothetical protein